MIFGLSKLLSVICYLLLPFFAFHWKIPFSALFFTAPNIHPMILPQFQVNKSIVLHLSSLYSAIYDNHQDLYFKIWLCNQLIHKEMYQAVGKLVTSRGKSGTTDCFSSYLCTGDSRENHSSHRTFRPHTDVGNSSVSHQWIRTKSQN